MKHKIFVYGTLKRGFCNHFYLDGSTFLGTTTTRDRYFMCVDHGIPYVFMGRKGNGFKGFVKGEVYLVDGAVLKSIDELEEHPHEYFRERVELKNFGCAWMYLYPHFSFSFYRGRLIKPRGGVIEFL